MHHQELQNRFEALLAPLLGAAYGLAYQMVRNRDDAEDLVQEASLLAFRAFHTFQPGTNFKGWFFRILTNCVYQRSRKKRREPEVAEFEEAAELYLYARSAGLEGVAERADPAAVVLGKLDTEAVSAAIAALPHEFRVVTALYFVEEFSYQEIAEILECPVGTVRSRLHRARRLLQKALWNIAQERGLPEGARGTEE